jgi:hypothetical protein
MTKNKLVNYMGSNLQIKENNNQFSSAFQRLFLNTAPKPTANDRFWLQG